MFSTAKETSKVEEHLQKLFKLDEGGWTCDIPEIDRQSLVELSQLRKPKLEVQLVITAMYMLLGIEEEILKVNSYVKYLSIRNCLYHISFPSSKQIVSVFKIVSRTSLYLYHIIIAIKD